MCGRYPLSGKFLGSTCCGDAFGSDNEPATLAGEAADWLPKFSALDGPSVETETASSKAPRSLRGVESGGFGHPETSKKTEQLGNAGKTVRGRRFCARCDGAQYERNRDL